MHANDREKTAEAIIQCDVLFICLVDLMVNSSHWQHKHFYSKNLAKRLKYYGGYDMIRASPCKYDYRLFLYF